jgi:hypothetical protein
LLYPPFAIRSENIKLNRGHRFIFCSLDATKDDLEIASAMKEGNNLNYRIYVVRLILEGAFIAITTALGIIVLKDNKTKNTHEI